MKDYDGDVKTKSNELRATGVIIESISNPPIEVYFKVKEISETKHEIFVQFKSNGDFISRGNDISGYTSAESILNNYATKLSQEASSSYFEDQEKELKTLENTLEKLAREKKKAEKDIEDCKETIKENEYSLEENKKNQISTVKQIEEQKKKVRNAKKEKDIFK